MKIIKNFELIIIITIALIIQFFNYLVPSYIETGKLLLFITVVLSLQSLVRDLYILTKNKYMIKDKFSSKETKKMMCMCVETTVGTFTLLLGFILIFSGVSK